LEAGSDVFELFDLFEVVEEQLLLLACCCCLFLLQRKKAGKITTRY
jgi:hypothetical protein